MWQFLKFHNQAGGDEISPSCNSQNAIDMHCANFTLNLMTRLKIVVTGIGTIIEEVINLIKIAEEVQHMDPNISVIVVLSNFKTQKQRTSFLSKNCSYISPEEIILGQSYKHKIGSLQAINDKGYIIPMMKSLQNFLNLPEVWSDIVNGHESDELMRDFCDGQFAKNNKFIQQNSPCLQFLINTDSPEVVNPIGAHVKRHKIDVFY